MRVLVVGATGTIGKPIVEQLKGKHEVVTAGRNHGDFRVDIVEPDSIRNMYKQAGRLDAVISVTGSAKFAPLAKLSDADFTFSLENKLMGQANLVRYGFDSVNDDGSFIITSGVLSHDPMPGSAAVSLVNAALEGFGRAAALEAPRGIRVNVISPGWVTETLIAFKMDPSIGLPASDVARAYVETLESNKTGKVIVVAKTA